MEKPAVMMAGFFVVGVGGFLGGGGCSLGLVANKMGKLLIYPESC